MRFVAILVLFAAPKLARAQLHIDPPTLDLGEVRGGPAVDCSFRLKNLGRQTVEIADLERSCGCVEPRFSARTLAPGEQATLTLRIRTLGQQDGPRTWPLTLVSRSGSESAKQRLDIKAVIRNEIALQPPQLAFFVTKAIEQEITLLDHRARPLKVTSAELKLAGAKIEQIAVEAGRTRFKISVDGAKLSPGRHEGVVHFFTDDVGYDHLEVPVTIVRESDVRASWTPDTPELIVASGQAKGSVLIQLRGLTQPVENIAGSDGVTCAWRSDEGVATIRATLDRDQFTGRGVQSALRVTAGGTTIAIPLLVRVE